MSEPNPDAANFDAVRTSARLNAPDRYYAALFAPAAARLDLISLAAFTGEIDRIARQVTEPTLGEIRIEWWREALLRAPEDGLSGNPVLDTFAAVARRNALPTGMFEDYLSAQAHALYADPPADDAALDLEFQAIDGTPFLLTANILGIVMDDQLLKAAARASGLTRVARELPYLLMRGRSPLPETRHPNAGADSAEWRPQIARLAEEAGDALALVRRHLAGKQRDFTTALLPLALVEPYFRALQDTRHEPARDIVEIAPLARMWRIARAHWTGRL